LIVEPIKTCLIKSRRSLCLKASIADSLVINQQAHESENRDHQPERGNSGRAKAQPGDDQK